MSQTCNLHRGMVDPLDYYPHSYNSTRSIDPVATMGLDFIDMILLISWIEVKFLFNHWLINALCVRKIGILLIWFLLASIVLQVSSANPFSPSLDSFHNPAIHRTLFFGCLMTMSFPSPNLR